MALTTRTDLPTAVTGQEKGGIALAGILVHEIMSRYLRRIKLAAARPLDVDERVAVRVCDARLIASASGVPADRAALQGRDGGCDYVSIMAVLGVKEIEARGKSIADISVVARGRRQIFSPFVVGPQLAEARVRPVQEAVAILLARALHVALNQSFPLQENPHVRVTKEAAVSEPYAPAEIRGGRVRFGLRGNARRRATCDALRNLHLAVAGSARALDAALLAVRSVREIVDGLAVHFPTVEAGARAV